MAEEAAQELPETKPGPAEAEEATNEGVELRAAECSPNDGDAASETDGVSNGKRSREEGGGGDEEERGEPKKLKVENSVEEERPGEDSGRVKLAAKEFGSSVEMYDYYFKFLHFWPANISVNKYEYLMLLELIKKGHAKPEKKIGSGIKAFQVRYHPVFKSRCFFLVREDESVDDFSFRKCVDHIAPLPDNMRPIPGANKALGGGKGKGGGGHGRGRGRGGKGRF